MSLQAILALLLYSVVVVALGVCFGLAARRWGGAYRGWLQILILVVCFLLIAIRIARYA